MTQTNSPSGRTGDDARGPERIWAESKTCTVDASGASRLLAMDREFSRGTEYIRADLATQPDPLADPRVVSLVEAVRHERELVCQDFDMQLAASKAVDEALAAFGTGGKADG